LKSSAKKSQKDTQKQRTVTLANISYPLSVSYVLTGHGDNYQLYPKDVEITAAYILTLPKWKTYRLASKADQDKWDDLFCKAIHHELGHLRINLDIISETLNGYAHLPRGVSTAKLTEAAKAYGEDVNAAVQKRQDIYHLYNGEGVRRGMVELPYAELPFPWLEAPTKD